ncbi:MAG TPA: hypothetical protein PK655_03455 [archaeon]|jgi:hypothetical protein|nr:hypothetical protein [archaeon]HPV66480.1 hypothetical protein [archaeon]
MNKVNLTKTLGAFITTISLLFLVFSIVDLFNQVDYIVEYDTCVNYSYNEETLASCKLNASNGLGFKIRENQLRLSTNQYLMVYTKSLLKILMSVTFFILGMTLYTRSSRTYIETKKVVAKKTSKKKKK